ncbi:MAG: TIGR00282 family metallophosphoesterase [Candidatus Babeliaceae bacterium]|jgi:hypothetical protein
MKIRILLLGDIVGAPGKAMVQKHLAEIKKKHDIQAVILNGENCAGDGRGITPRSMKFFKHIGVDVVTSGNHIFQKKDIYSYLTEHKDLVRPLNFPSGCPGSGVTTFSVDGVTVGVINVQGRVFMRELVSCPFRAVESALTFLQSRTKVILIDMHAEATSEKLGLAYFVEGKVSAVVGTHTHVQTADERILPGGTAYISDLGMSGALHSMIGMKREIVIRQMLTQMPAKFEVETEGPMCMTGAIIDIDSETGKAIHIERLKVIDENLKIDHQDLGDK